MAGSTDVATHQKTQQGLKLCCGVCKRDEVCGRNASENPAGIETYLPLPNAKNLSNVATHQKTQQGLKR